MFSMGCRYPEVTEECLKERRPTRRALIRLHMITHFYFFSLMVFPDLRGFFWFFVDEF